MSKKKTTTIIKLTEDQRLMVIIRDELYDGSWGGMEKDLRDRLNGKPVIEKLCKKIERDLVCIDQLQMIEKAEGINLTTLL